LRLIGCDVLTTDRDYEQPCRVGDITLSFLIVDSGAETRLVGPAGKPSLQRQAGKGDDAIRAAAIFVISAQVQPV
jgi:hypothetical protein